MSCIHNSAVDPVLKRYRGSDYYYADLARAYASSTCSDQCAPFKNSPGTYDTCCKQHAANAPKPAATPAPTKFAPITPAPGPSPSKSGSSACKSKFGGSCTGECATPTSQKCKDCEKACGGNASSPDEVAPDTTTPDTTPADDTTTTPAEDTTTTPDTTTTTTEDTSATSGGSGFSMSSLFQNVCGTGSKIPLLCNNEGTFTAIVVILAVTFIVLIMKRL